MTSEIIRKLPVIMINYEEFQKIELRVAKVREAERIAGSEKLIRLQIDLGAESRQIVAGIGQFYQPEDLVGREVVVVANLESKTLMGVESRGMILAADAGRPVILVPDEEVPPGAGIR